MPRARGIAGLCIEFSSSRTLSSFLARLPADSGIALLIRMIDVDDPTLQKTRDIIGRQVEQMTRMVHDLLDVSRIARGKVPLDMREVDLCKVAGAGAGRSSSSRSRANDQETSRPGRWRRRPSSRRGRPAAGSAAG